MADEASIGSINFNIKGSADEAKKSLDGLSGSLKGVNTALKAISVVGLVKGFKGIATWVANNVSKTSEYIAALNKFNVAMGASNQAATEFINKAEKNLGLDPQRMMESVSSIQLLAEGFGISNDKAYIMSKNLSQLAADMTAFGYSHDLALQKVKSGLAGEIEPMRAIGVALDKNTLQQVAYANGINMSVDAMTRAQKTELIYYQIMMSTQKMQGMLAKSVISPQVAIMQLKNEFLQLARAIGSVFIPIAMKIIPVVRAVTQLLTEAAQWLAHLFGFELGKYTANVDNIGTSIGGIADNLDNVGGSARKTTRELQKMLMPFDELNNVNFETGGSGGSGSGGVGGLGGSLGLDLPQYDMFEGLDKSINEKVENIKNKIKEFLPTLRTIAEIIASIWAINKISNFAGWVKTLAGNFGLLGSSIGSGSVASLSSTGVVGALALLIADIQEVIRIGERYFSDKDAATQEYLWQTGKTEDELTSGDRANIFLHTQARSWFGERLGSDWQQKYSAEEALDKALGTQEGWNNQSFIHRFGLVPVNIGYNIGETIKGNKEFYDAVKDMPVVSAGASLGERLTENIGDNDPYLEKVAINAIELLTGNDPFVKPQGAVTTREDERLEKLTKNLTPEEFKENLGKLKESFKPVLNEVSSFVDSIKQRFKTIPNIFQSLLDKLKPKLTALKERFGTTFKNVKDSVVSFLKGTNAEGGTEIEGIKTAFSEKIGSVRDSIKQRFSGTKDDVVQEIDKISTNGSSAWQRIKTAFSTEAQSTQQGIVTPFEQAKNSVIDKVTTMKDRTSTEFQAIKDTVKNKFETIPSEGIKPFETLKNNLWNTLTKTSNDTGSKMDEIKRKLNFSGFSWQLPALRLPHFSWTQTAAGISSGIAAALNKLSLPTSLPQLKVSWYAEGGFPNAGELFFANENGPELIGNMGRRTAVANNDQITEGIAVATYNAISRALQENSSSNSSDNYFEINLGNERLYSGYATQRDRDSRRYGVQT